MYQIYNLSDYKIDENYEDIKIKINNFNLNKNNNVYEAFKNIEALILQDGVSQKFNNIFLNFIIDNFQTILEEYRKNELNNIELENEKNEAPIDFDYLSECFNKYEIVLNEIQLKQILEKKKMYNNKVINENNKYYLNYKELNNKSTADEIFETINKYNKEEEDDNKKILFIYNYLNINNDDIFKNLAKNIFYLDEFYFGHSFYQLGIPISCYYENDYLIYRYFFSIIKTKINKNINFFNEKVNNDMLKFIFRIFEPELTNKSNPEKKELMKYFAFLFSNIIFEIQFYSEHSDNENLEENHKLYRLFNQFRGNEKLDEELKHNIEKYKIKEEINESSFILKKETIKIENKNYSINSCILYLYNNNLFKNSELIKNYSQKLFNNKPIYSDYLIDFVNLLKTICISYTVTTLQSSRDEFKMFESFFKNKNLLDELFEEKLKFLPFECSDTFGITDKCLCEIYLSSICVQDIPNLNKIDIKNHIIIIKIYNMALTSVIFQHEGLNHYIRGYLSYSDENTRISIKTNINKKYYPAQNLNNIVEEPLYLKKFKKELSESELNELSKSVFELSKEKKNEEYECKDDKMDIEDIELNEENNDDDEGFFYERQLFTMKNEKKLSKINLLQAIMLLDQDAYNLEPIFFHYCFIKLNNAKNYKIIKKNFQGELLKKIFNELTLTEDNLFKIQNNTLMTNRKRNNFNGLFFNRYANDVMPSDLEKLKTNEINNNRRFNKNKIRNKIK